MKILEKFDGVATRPVRNGTDVVVLAGAEITPAISPRPVWSIGFNHRRVSESLDRLRVVGTPPDRPGRAARRPRPQSPPAPMIRMPRLSAAANAPIPPPGRRTTPTAGPRDGWGGPVEIPSRAGRATLRPRGEAGGGLGVL